MGDKPTVRLEWGVAGARSWPEAEVAIVVDVLSFSTAVSVAVERGAAILPVASRDGAAGLAQRLGAVCAGRRGEDGFSLSPESFQAALPGQRIVLPSPNGATVSVAARARHVLAGCLRNASAVAEAARRLGSRVLIVPAGERSPDGVLRFALEDMLGAGAIAGALGGILAPEAAAARAAFKGARRGSLAAALAATPSGLELIAWGYAGDVLVASELDASAATPVLRRLDIRHGDRHGTSIPSAPDGLGASVVCLYEAPGPV